LFLIIAPAQLGEECETGADCLLTMCLLPRISYICSWVKSVKLVQTAATGPLLSYKLKPAEGWKVATEASLRSKTLAASVTFKALKGE
jgi:hypothetical protein